jgi:NADH-quinone oxidoreductase subunit E
MAESGTRVDRDSIVRIVEKQEGERGGLISVLEKIQDQYGYLPEAALRTVAEKTRRPLTDVYGVATFYRYFRLQPRGKHLISACLGTACHVRGGPAVVAEFERQLGVRAGGTTPNGEFTFETVNCLGACALGPVAVIDGHYFSKVSKPKIRPLLEKAKEGFDKVDVGSDKRVFPVELSCPRCNHSLMDAAAPIDGLPSIRLTMSLAGRHGRLRLSSLYGSDHVSAEPEVPEGQVAGLFCPHCHGPLDGRPECPDCQAPMASLLVRGGGTLRFCSRRGCRNRLLDLT